MKDSIRSSVNIVAAIIIHAISLNRNIFNDAFFFLSRVKRSWYIKSKLVVKEKRYLQNVFR